MTPTDGAARIYGCSSLTGGVVSFATIQSLPLAATDSRGGSDASSDPAPLETGLQRAVASHLAAGKDWHLRTGWLDLRMTPDLLSELSP